MLLVRGSLVAGPYVEPGLITGAQAAWRHGGGGPAAERWGLSAAMHAHSVAWLAVGAPAAHAAEPGDCASRTRAGSRHMLLSAALRPRPAGAGPLRPST